MHVFAIAVDIPALTPERLSNAIRPVAGEFRLDASTSWTVRSRSGTITAAGTHHGGCAVPRRYVSHSPQAVTFFDGLPVDPEGEHSAYDASVLAAGWHTWADRLEGQFAAARIDLAREQVEIRPDTFGLVDVFLARHEGGTLVSTSIRVIQSLLGLTEPDELGVSAMMGTGTVLDRTLVAGVVPLAGGSVHRISDGTVSARSIFGPAPASRRSTPPSVADLAQRMTRLVESATRDVDPVQCPITAGRDSRVLVALLLAGGVPADFYTAGRVGEPDVDISRELAARFDLPHRVIEPGRVQAPIDGLEAAARFIEQTEGFSTLIQLVDYIDLEHAPRRVGLKLWGAGGEVGRGHGLPVTIANLPLVGHFSTPQRWALRQAFTRNGIAYLTKHGIELLDAHLDGFFEARRVEGWRVNELSESLFTFDGPGWGHGGPRRAAGADDVFSPFRTRMFAEYCLALSPAERYVEAPHHRLLMELSPALREFRYEFPFQVPQPSLAGLRALRELRLLAQRRLGRAPAATTAGGGEWFMPAWVERNIDVLRALFEPADSSLWELIQREPILRLVEGSPEDRRRSMASLLRAATVFWFFSGPRPRLNETWK